MRNSAWIVLLVAACSGRSGGTDSGPRDAGGGNDAMISMDDAAIDSGMPGVDSGPRDGGIPPGPDSGPPPDPSEQIRVVREAAPGALTPGLPIDGALVTYVKPLLGDDVAGFFVQARRMGPAIFVGVDPATLTPVPVPGDAVAFVVDETATNQGRREVTLISSFNVLSNGNDIDALVEDLTKLADLVTNSGDYESEYVFINGTIASDFGFSGVGHVAAQFDTPGVTGNPDLLFRIPDTLRASADLAPGCNVLMTGPFWRYFSPTLNRAQPSAYLDDDILVSCPAPTVVSAIALTPTTVQITFDRQIDPASITNAMTQFTFDGGLVATSATVTGNTVTVTLTSTQVGGTTYTATVTGVTDTYGTDIGTPNSAPFIGFLVPAGVVINELNAHITNGCDLIELRVVSGGTMGGYEVRERTAMVHTFPTTFVVRTNDIILLHFNRVDMRCSGGVAFPADELTAPDAVLRSVVSSNVDTAYDFYLADTGLFDTDTVITVRQGTGVLVDALLASDAATGTAAGDSETAAVECADTREWTAPDGSTPVFMDDVFSANAALDLDGTGTTVGGQSIQRNSNADTNNKNDWTQGASSWGTLNASQIPF